MSEAMRFEVKSRLGTDLALGICRINRKWESILDRAESSRSLEGARARWDQEIFDVCVKGMEAIDRERGEVYTRVCEQVSRFPPAPQVVTAHSPKGIRHQRKYDCGCVVETDGSESMLPRECPNCGGEVRNVG